MMWGYGFNAGWMWLFGPLVLVGVVLLVIVAVRSIGGGVYRGSTRGDAGVLPTQGTKSTARQVLDERYAKGELTTEEYQERLKVLGETA
ncbi:MAG: SHOCT domain-containing protein [Lacisediminihabitans sp.]